ncbi:MAG: hypothetical protein HYT75_03990 [Deltaproteobacteria bacterium]|nr:hypothetical protein [Deltaproteobacteria bacterium]
MRTILILTLILVSATAIAKPPKWITQVHWEDAEYEYFVGVSSKAASEEIGRREAYDNATAEAVQSMFGISGRMDLASYANLQKIQISQDVFISTDEVQLKSETVDVYSEKMKEGGRMLYNVWRSIKVDKKAAKAELARLKQIAEEKKTVEAKVISPEADVVAVTVEGNAVIVNEDEPSAKAAAIKQGIKRSCEKLMEDWFYADVLSNNYPKFNSLIYNRCAAFSKNHEIQSGFAEDNIYKVDMTVFLNGGDIRRKLMDAGLYRQKFPQ